MSVAEWCACVYQELYGVIHMPLLNSCVITHLHRILSYCLIFTFYTNMHVVFCVNVNV